MEWQPIETAPKDGTRVLVYVEPFGSLIGSNTFNLFGRTSGDRWYCDGVWLDGSVPTHWMPLPEPPK
jgi:hypothetical protein